MKTKTIITYIPWTKKKSSVRKKKTIFRPNFFKYGKFVLLLFLVGIYLIYTNQSSTLWYSLRNGLRTLEKTQEQYDAIQLQVSQKEQELRSKVERKPNKKQMKKIIVEW